MATIFQHPYNSEAAGQVPTGFSGPPARSVGGRRGALPETPELNPWTFFR